MNAEKNIAIVLATFNVLTNLLMLLPAVFFGILLSNAGGMELALVLVGYACIVFSFYYGFHFMKTWFRQDYDKESSKLMWLVSIVHYTLFLLYMIWLLYAFEAGANTTSPIIQIIGIPLLTAILGLFINLNKKEQAARQMPEDLENDHILEFDQPIIISSNSTDMDTSGSSYQNTGGSGFYRFSQWLKESLFVKFFSIGFLVLLLLIPIAMIKELIREREYRQAEVKNEVSLSWGGSQAIQGPVLTVPYTTYTMVEGKQTEERHIAYFLPQTLDVDGDLKHQIRKRSIFDVVLYQAGITLSGEFQQPDFQAFNLEKANVHWNEARLAVGIRGMTGIKEAVQVDWSGEVQRMEPGTGITGLLASGVSAPVKLGPDGAGYRFSIPIKLNGSEYLSFEPVGKATTVKLKSDWPSPSFEGAFLPDQRDIAGTGFSAAWQVLDLNRSYPQQWKDDVVRFATTGGPQASASYSSDTAVASPMESTASNIAVRLIQPVDEYQKNTRSAKYAILVVGLTFLLYFFFEMLRKLFIHPFQYLLVGLALTVFYLLLLSLSEHLGFNAAYLVSSMATISLICVYSVSMLKIRRLVWQLLTMLVGIYGFIFILLQLEDYALLAGSIGVFLALAAVMFSSRKVDWYNLGSQREAVLTTTVE